jgi:acetoin utilization deacetylase AcuC-like enzyme
MVAAAEYVLTAPRQHALQVAVSPTSGFHHAGHDFGGGFCTFNGLMVAAIRAHDLGLARRILILDMDQHYGNGTDDIIEKLNIDYIDHITASKSYDTAEAAMAASDLSRNEALADRQYDLVLYQAGADIHVDDPLGGLLTTEQMRRRDCNVFGGCAAFGAPIVWNLAGGYQRDDEGTIAPVLALHRNTMIECISGAVPGQGSSTAAGNRRRGLPAVRPSLPRRSTNRTK